MIFMNKNEAKKILRHYMICPSCRALMKIDKTCKNCNWNRKRSNAHDIKTWNYVDKMMKKSYKQMDIQVAKMKKERRAKVEFKATTEYQIEGLKYTMAMSA